MRYLKNKKGEIMNNNCEKFNPYDLDAIAKIRNKHKKRKQIECNSWLRPPYMPEQHISAYDLSKRPDGTR